MACLVLVGELAWSLNLCSPSDRDVGLSCFRGWVGLNFKFALFWWQTGLSYFSWWVGLVFNLHCSGDRDCTCLLSGCELAWFLICTALVTETVVHLVSEGKLTWFSIHLALVTETVVHLLSGGKLTWNSICTALVTEAVAFLVSEGELTWFLIHTLLVTGCGLSCFSG